jgi:hypothetical protein
MQKTYLSISKWMKSDEEGKGEAPLQPTAESVNLKNTKTEKIDISIEANAKYILISLPASSRPGLSGLVIGQADRAFQRYRSLSWR